MKNYYLLFLYFILILNNVNAQYPTINNTRPRIYADSSRINWLQNNILTSGDCQNTFNNISIAYNNWWINDPQLYLLGNDSSQWTWNWGAQYAKDQAFISMLIYKLTSNSIELKRNRFIIQKLIDTVNTTNFSTMATQPKESLLRVWSDVGGFLLDWDYNNLPVGLRDSLVQTLFKINDEFMNTYIYSTSGNSYVSGHNILNAIYCNQNSLVLNNASGLSVSQQSKVTQWYQYVYNKFVNGFIPCWSYYRDDDGGWNWGSAYSMWSLIDQYHFFENMRISTSKNFYNDLPWLQNSINQYLYFIRPDGKTIHLGDGETELKPDRVVYLNAKHYNDYRSLWLSQTLPTPNTVDKLAKLLYKDFTKPLVNQPNNPLNWYADKIGLSVSRSSWSNDATMLTYYNALNKKAGHEHRDNNSFTIFKNKPLLIDAGYYDSYASNHYKNYYERTIAHNSICVFDSTDSYYYYGNLVSNDGGQIESNTLQNYNDIFLPQNQRGNWIKYADGNQYVYHISDAQLSYDTNKVSFYRRRFLFLKPNKAIVLDHIHLKNISTKQRDISWNAHFVNKPFINGSLTNTNVFDHIETYNGKDYTSTNGNGNIAIRTLLPDSVLVRRIGGDGYEYFVNGTNYPPTITPDTNYYTPGSWRIEVRPTSSNDTVLFLHTINVGDSSNNSMAGGLALRNNVSVGADWNDSLYFFSAKGDIEVHYHYFNQVQGNRTISLFAFDLQEGTYQIKIDGSVVNVLNTDTSGIINTSLALVTGSHLIEIVPYTSLIVEQQSQAALMVFPNPVKTELNIASISHLPFDEIEITDVLSRLVLKNEYQKKIDVSSLSSGIYIIKIEYNGSPIKLKFIKE